MFRSSQLRSIGVQRLFNANIRGGGVPMALNSMSQATNEFSTKPASSFASDITVYGAASFLKNPAVTARSVIVVDDLKEFQTLSTDSNVAKVLNLSNNGDFEVLKELAETLKPGNDAVSLDHYLACGPEKKLTKVTLIALPTLYTRHNTPSRSYSLATVMKGQKGSDEAVKVILLPKETDFALAQTYAISRQFPLYSFKSNHIQAIKDNIPSQKVSIIIEFPNKDANKNDTKEEALIQEANIAIENIRLAQELVDTPPNVLHTDRYVEICQNVAKELGCEIKVIQGSALQEQGFGGLWGVGKAGEHLPALVIMSYYPPNTSKASKEAAQEEEESVCLVGKGLVYDTGGLSLKIPFTSMQTMKMDMAGSAAVLGAFVTTVKQSQQHIADGVTTGTLKRPLHALLCIAENAIGPLATRPDDIHTLLSGKTVEVINTDAEGRLVLSDGVYYASKYLKPKVIIDIATLTGAQLIATGKRHAAIQSNSESLETIAFVAGKATGDLTFPIIYCPEFFQTEYTSTLADMTNLATDRTNAASSCAGQFIANHLEEFLSQGGEWLHIDMAGSAMAKDRATGYGVALLHEITKKLQ